MPKDVAVLADSITDDAIYEIPFSEAGRASPAVSEAMV